MVVEKIAHAFSQARSYIFSTAANFGMLTIPTGPSGMYQRLSTRGERLRGSRLADFRLAPDAVGRAGAPVVFGHDSGCA